MKQVRWGSCIKKTMRKMFNLIIFLLNWRAHESELAPNGIDTRYKQRKVLLFLHHSHPDFRPWRSPLPSFHYSFTAHAQSTCIRSSESTRRSSNRVTNVGLRSKKMPSHCSWGWVGGRNDPPIPSAPVCFDHSAPWDDYKWRQDDGRDFRSSVRLNEETKSVTTVNWMINVERNTAPSYD